MRRQLVGLTAVLLMVSACGNDPEDVELGDGAVPSVGPEESPEESEQPDAQGEAAAGSSPAPDECIDLPPADDGVYAVADAGTVTLTFADGALTLDGVEPAEGWEHEVTEEEAEEVEVELRRDEEEVDLEAEVDDGDLQVKVCSDSD